MKPIAALASFLLIGTLIVGQSSGAEMLVIGPTRSPGTEDLPQGWQHAGPGKPAAPTRYRMVQEVGADVLRADGHASAPGLYRPLEVDPTVYQVIAWRWKVQKRSGQADASRGAAHNPAQVYIKFRYDPAKASLWERITYRAYRAWYGEYPDAGVLRYVWDRRQPRGTVQDVPGAKRERIIVLRGAPEDSGRWVEEERNLYRDYREAFGREPFPIVGLGVMTNTAGGDDTAVAWYGQIALRTLK